MKKFLTVITAVLVLLFATTVQAKTKGNLTFGLTKDSTDTEQLDIGVKIEIEPDLNEKVGVELSLDFGQEKDADNLKELNIESTMQGNYFYNDNLYAYLAFDYERDITWFIDDSISIGPGAGYKTTNFFIQSGLYYNNTYIMGYTCDDKTLWETTAGYKKPMGDITLAILGEASFNMAGNMFDDYTTVLEPIATLKVNDNFYLQGRHELKYKRLAQEKYQRTTSLGLVMEF